MAELHLKEFAKAAVEPAAPDRVTFCVNVRRWILNNSHPLILGWLELLVMQMKDGLHFHDWVAYQHYRHSSLDIAAPDRTVVDYHEFATSCVPICRGSDYSQWDWDNVKILPPCAGDWMTSLMSSQEVLEGLRREGKLTSFIADFAAQLLLRSAYELEVNFQRDCPPTLLVRTILGLKDLKKDNVVGQFLLDHFREYMVEVEGRKHIDLFAAVRLEQEKHEKLENEKLKNKGVTP